MARARCTECRAHVWWTASRGARLKDQRCPACGSSALVGGKSAGRAGIWYHGAVCVVCHVHREPDDPLLVPLEDPPSWGPGKGCCVLHPQASVEEAIRRIWSPKEWLETTAEEVLGRYRAAVERGMPA